MLGLHWSSQTHSRISYDAFTILGTPETRMLSEPRDRGIFLLFFLCEDSSPLTIASLLSLKRSVVCSVLYCLPDLNFAL